MLSQWVRNFSVPEDDIDAITNRMLEQETPMTTDELTRILVEKHLEAERSKIEERYKDAQVYNPAHVYQKGQRLIFSKMDYATAVVADTRSGHNPEYGDFSVIAVEFDDSAYNTLPGQREFAAGLGVAHSLNDASLQDMAAGSTLTTEQIMEEKGHVVRVRVQQALEKNTSLVRVAGYWFPQELVMDIDIGTLHLSEAVLDMAGGGPLTTSDIIDQIGGLGDGPRELQIFSLNLALNQDDRFDEVGPAGTVLWHLKRMQPEKVQTRPALLRYTDIPYNEDLLDDIWFDLETELDDELTPVEFEGNLKKATTTLIYPHRRVGTLPLNAKNRQIFPTARTPRISVKLIDKLDGTTYPGWVVHEHKYVFGLGDYYTKHRLPIGAYVTVEKGDEPGHIIISHDAYRPRTEWIHIMTARGEQVTFETKKRSIGAEYDELYIIGVDDLEGLDQLTETLKNRNLVTILRMLVQELSKLTPQNMVHAITLYSAVNMLRRCAPGPIFALLQANPEFENVGDYYWRLSSEQA